MNPAVFAALPVSACTAGTAGTAPDDFGPDRITQNIYDAASRVVQVKTAVGTLDAATEVTTAYTANGQVSSVSDAENNKTSYTYDGQNRLSKTQYPVPAKGSNASSASDYEQLTYDANGNVTQRRLRDGQLINYVYDNLNRVTSKDLPGAEIDVSYSYDLIGRTKVATTGTTTNSPFINFGYDALGRVISTSVLIEGALNYTYDAAGRRTSVTYPGTVPLIVNYDYDVTGNMTRIRENGATSGAGILARYSYDNLGRRASITFGNGTVKTYTYDAASRIASLGADLAGTTSDQTAAFTYNPASQIAGLSKSNDTYAWNGHYNIDRPYTANGLNQQTATGAVALTYDAKGNLSQSGSNVYTYTAENQLQLLAGVFRLSYDPTGRLLQTSTLTVATHFGYDGANLIAEYDTARVLTRRYVHGPGDDEAFLWYEGAGLTDKRYMMSDERGSITSITDGAGAVLGINRYDEYGIPASTNIGRFGYTGQTWLPEIGMNYYKARIYSPTLGRFLQTDPIGYADGINWYAYVGGDPVNGRDPSGLLADIVVTASRFPRSDPPSIFTQGLRLQGGFGNGGPAGNSGDDTIVVVGGATNEEEVNEIVVVGAVPRRNTPRTRPQPGRSVPQQGREEPTVTMCDAAPPGTQGRCETITRREACARGRATTNALQRPLFYVGGANLGRQALAIPATSSLGVITGIIGAILFGGYALGDLQSAAYCD
jgi:RHS repeat-associated protein